VAGNFDTSFVATALAEPAVEPQGRVEVALAAVAIRAFRDRTATRLEDGGVRPASGWRQQGWRETAGGRP
jgi:hypothetical protein